MSGWRVERGDSLALLKGLEDDSVDAVVTDPPSGIAFMGRAWDTDKGGRAQWVAWLASILEECRRVLKPGGHLLVWALPRTSHWTGAAIDDAGFEIRDVLQHHFGSGFPKNLDVSKAIDRRRHDRDQVLQVTRWIAEARDAAGLTNAAIDELFGFSGMAGHWTTQESQPAVPTLDQIPALLELLRADPPEEIARLIFELNGRKGEPGEAWHRREVVGTKTAGIATPGEDKRHTIGGSKAVEVNVTTAATEEAETWEGWGTALKPSTEFWWLARKPFRGPVAGNILEHGTAALNIDACRISEGRWPPHLLLSHSADCIPWARAPIRTGGIAFPDFYECAEDCPVGRVGDEIAHFFPNLTPDPTASGDPLWRYIAKPPKSEKDAGVTRAPSTGGEATGRVDGSAGLKNPRAGAGRGGGARNIHPTVKPIALMRWLIRLVTPPGGVVLDPFCGSGSTGCAAVLDGFSFLGFDLDEDENGEPLGHLEIARDRIAWWSEVDRYKVTERDGFGTRTPGDSERDDMKAQGDLFS